MDNLLEVWRVAMAKQHLKIKDVARLSKIKEQHVYRIFDRRCNPRYSDIEKICVTLKVEVIINKKSNE